MTFALTPAIPFVDLTGAGSTITAAAANFWRTKFPDAIDGAGGGTYGPTAAINLTGAFGLTADTLGLNAGGTATFNATSIANVYGKLQVRSAGLIDVLSGGIVDVESGGLIEVKASGTLKTDASSTLEVNGHLNVLGTADIAVSASASCVFAASSIVVAGGIFGFTATSVPSFNGCTIEVGNSAVTTLNVEAASFLAVYGTLNIKNTGVQNVQSSGEFHTKSGSVFHVESGTTSTIAADTTFSGAIIHSGNGGGSAYRVDVLGVGVGGPPTVIHADETEDEWEVAANLAANQQIRLDAPANVNERWAITITRNRGNSNATIVTVYDDGTNTLLCSFLDEAHIVLTTGPTFSSTATFAWADLRWKVSTGEWVLVRGGGPGFYLID